MYTALRPLLFRLDPERAHALTIKLLRLAGSLPPAARLLRHAFAAPDRPVRVFGLDFKNPIGLAAGYDKDGLALRGLACLGFGHIEVGTVTLRPQPGNPRPRVFRLPADRAVINRMGFPGRGAAFVARHIDKPPGVVLGVNIGKNKDTPLENALDDYLALLEVFAARADYLAINVSSPNTPGLRSLQARDALTALLSPLDAARHLAVEPRGRPLPLLVKLAPDLDDLALDGLLEAALETGMDGIIATNTTTTRPPLAAAVETAAETGGLSGAPLHPLALRTVGEVVRRTQGRLPVVAAGGVMDAASARRFLDLGASLVQVYTGLVYAGPGLAREILIG